MPFLWFVAVSARIGSQQEARLETHFQTWSISEVANLQNIAAVKAISALTENGKKVLTMAEYIEREAAIRALLNDAPEQVGYSREDAADCIRYMDAADVATVLHGRWKCNKPCPVCGGDRFDGLDADIWADWEPPYCPNCGAKMDGGEP